MRPPYLLTCEEMAAADQAAISRGVSGATLMEAAGRAVADRAICLLPTRGRVTVICGPGNNGGDGFVVARRLDTLGYTVTLMLMGARDQLRGDAATMAAQWPGRVQSWSGDLAEPELVVDALFGAGLSRPLEGDFAALVDAVNGHEAPTLAVDIPSGIDGDTGSPLGSAIQATETVTFFRLKPGHLLMPGRAHCGRVTVAEIGIPSAVLDDIQPKTYANEPSLWRGDWPDYAIDAHKYDRGHTLVVSGPGHRTGAARLAAHAALRAGAGLVTVASPADAVAANAAHLTAVMIAPFDTTDDFRAITSDERMNAVIIGPAAGVDANTRERVGVLLSSSARVVLDADALTAHADAPQALFDQLRPDDVLTPHMGEFRRLFPDATDAPCKLAAARKAAAKAGCIVVIKGADTVIAAPDGRAAINANAPRWLATAGAGDVLCGIIAGLLSQGMPGWPAVCAAVWLHGACGRVLGRGLISEEIADALPDVLRQLPQADGL